MNDFLSNVVSSMTMPTLSVFIVVVFGFIFRSSFNHIDKDALKWFIQGSCFGWLIVLLLMLVNSSTA
jgi:uncharacterized membrane protein YjjB (DUF3815 family)